MALNQHKEESESKTKTPPTEVEGRVKREVLDVFMGVDHPSPTAISRQELKKRSTQLYGSKDSTGKLLGNGGRGAEGLGGATFL